MSFNVVVPFRDYAIPVNVERSRVHTTAYTSGFLKINATDYLLINSSGDRLIIVGGGTNIQAPAVVVPFRDYVIPVPERDTDG